MCAIIVPRKFIAIKSKGWYCFGFWLLVLVMLCYWKLDLIEVVIWMSRMARHGRGRARHEQPLVETPPAPRAPGMTNPGDDLIIVLRGLAHYFTTTQNQPPPPPAPRDTLTQVVEQFCRFNPPVFNGRGEPAVAEEWLRSLERIFTHIACTDAQKVSCAIFQMTEDADH